MKKTIRHTIIMLLLAVAPSMMAKNQNVGSDQSDILKLKLAQEHKVFAAAKQNLVLQGLLSREKTQRNILVTAVIALALVTIFLLRRINLYRAGTVVATPSAFVFPQNVSRESDPILSQREKQILQGLASGMSHKQIAAERAISYHTVRYHIKNIYSKLKVRSLAEAVAEALRQKLVE
jgi:DNA-binding NarL/FixJ family response regulator